MLCFLAADSIHEPIFAYLGGEFAQTICSYNCYCITTLCERQRGTPRTAMIRITALPFTVTFISSESLFISDTLPLIVTEDLSLVVGQEVMVNVGAPSPKILLIYYITLISKNQILNNFVSVK